MSDCSDFFFSLSDDDENGHVEDYMPAWVQCIALTEFSDAKGHSIKFCYPRGALTEEEKTRLAVESLPDCNIVPSNDEVVFGFRFRRTRDLPWLKSNSKDDVNFQGVCITYSRTCSESKRGVKHFALSILSPLLWFDVLVFLCRTVLFESKHRELSPIVFISASLRCEEDSLSSNREIQDIRASMIAVYETFSKTVGTRFPIPGMPMDVVMIDDESEVRRRYRMKAPCSSPFGGVNNYQPLIDALPDETFHFLCDCTPRTVLLNPVQWNPSCSSSGVRLGWPEKSLLCDHPFTDISSELSVLKGHLIYVWERILLGDSIVVLGSTPSVVSSVVLFFVRMIAPVGYAGDMKPYAHSMSSDYFELMQLCQSHRSDSQTNTEDLAIPHWLVDTQRRLVNASQKMFQNMTYSVAGTYGDQLFSPQVKSGPSTVVLPRQVIVGTTNPMSLNQLRPFDCTVVVDSPTSSSPMPQKTTGGFVPLVFRKKRIAHSAGQNNDVTYNHTWIASSSTTYLGTTGARWVEAEISKARAAQLAKGEELEMFNILGGVFHQLSLAFINPLEKEFRNLASRARHRIKTNPLSTPLNGIDQHENRDVLDENLIDLFSSESFLSRLLALNALPEPFMSMDRPRCCTMFEKFFTSQNSKIAIERIVWKINNELRLMRLVILIHSQEDKLITPTEKSVLHDLMKSSAYNGLNSKSKLIVLRISNNLI
eukprot:GHVH01012125.1.p1 GENE.GHVH01012125.1~~GHVH01012125.1.p1  ORF type:complete len:708 (+),score=79.42 GHVH01012125.1:27-2150(+)